MPFTTDPSVREIDACEVCGNRKLTPVLDLGSQPMCDDLVVVGDERECREYPIEILFCDTCVTAHQRFQIPKRTLFPSTYHYRSRFTADVLSGMEGLVASVERRFGSLEKKTVLDIGCNDGSLLGFFRERGAVTIGIEPTDAALDAKAKGHSVFQDYLSTEVAETIAGTFGKPNVVTFTNVFAHIENLSAVIESLKRLMGSDTILIIENHYLGSVLNGHQFDTFYHEHPRTYSSTSFGFIAEALEADLIDVEFPSRYGGNIRVFVGVRSASISNRLRADIAQEEKQFGQKFESLKSGMLRWQKAKRTELADLLQRHGKLRAKAFPGRASILVKLLQLDERAVAAVYEKPGSLKIGHYLPGTRIPIRSDNELFELPATSAPLLNLAWHIPGEIKQYLKDHQYNGPVTDILTQEDFASAG